MSLVLCELLSVGCEDSASVRGWRAELAEFVADMRDERAEDLFTECCVCYTDFDDAGDTRMRVIDCCFHAVCKDCLREFRKNNKKLCPMCI